MLHGPSHQESFSRLPGKVPGRAEGGSNKLISNEKGRRSAP